MVNSTLTSSASTAPTSSPCPAHAQHLLTELQHADAIIKAMLNAMTIQQKTKVHAQLDAAGVSGEGMTRANERHAVIQAANKQTQSHTALADQRSCARLSDIGVLATDIESQTLTAQTLCDICFDEIDGCTPSDPEDMRRTIGRLDALVKAVYRNARLAQDAADTITVHIMVLKGGAA